MRSEAKKNFQGRRNSPPPPSAYAAAHTKGLLGWVGFGLEILESTRLLRQPFSPWGGLHRKHKTGQRRKGGGEEEVGIEEGGKEEVG